MAEDAELSKAIGDAILAALKTANLTIAAAAAKTGIHTSSFGAWTRGFRRAQLSGMLLIEEVCGLPRGWILRKAGLVEDRLKLDVFHAIRSDDRLTVEQQASLCVIIEGLVKGNQ